MLWVKSLETGITKIDEQHKKLFEQVDLLLDKSNSNRHKDIIIFLDNYIEKHFTDEQQMHRETKYPNADAHKKMHDDFIIVFHKIKDKFLKEGANIANNMEINKTVVRWMKDHIIVHDKEYAVYCKSLN